MKVIGYIGSNKALDAEKKLDIKLQQSKIENFCNKNNFELIKIYMEPVESSDNYKPALVNLLGDIEKIQFKKVIISDINVFGNNDIIKKLINQELKKHSAEITVLSDKTEEKTINTQQSEEKINKIKLKVRDIPSLPEVVTKVMELVQNPNSSASQLSKVISHDPGLTSRVLRLVNSAYYGFPKQISSIQHAIMILGFTTMRGLVLSSSIFKIFTSKNKEVKILDYKRLWKHSLITAISSKITNQHLYFQEEEDIFSAAILHDIGKIILEQYDHENFIKAFQEAPSPLLSYKVLAAEKKHCEVTHAEIGFMVTEGWNLPENLCNVILHHHNPLEADEHKKLASIVYIGNIIAHIALDEIEFNIDFFDNEVLEYLGISEEDLLEINSKILEEIHDIGDFEVFFK